ncbi:replicative DNA helicase [bacterium]|nr:replicative DNA helicase [bacterium]
MSLNGNISLPICDTEAEAACLGSCLADSEAFDRVSEIIAGPEDFYLKKNQEIYLAMAALNERSDAIDLVTVAEYLKSHGKLENCGGWIYLDKIMERVGRAANVKSYAKIVAEKGVLRRLSQAGRAVVELADDGDISVKDKIDQAEELVFAVGNRNNAGNLTHISYALNNVFERTYKICQEGGSFSGLPSGFIDLDELTTGFHKSNLIVVGARPSMGKTAFALSIAVNAALSQIEDEEGSRRCTVALFSLEMSAEDLGMRMMCSMAEVDGQRMRTGRLDGNDLTRLAEACGRLSEANIFIDDRGGITVLDIKARLRRLKKRQNNLDLVIIDYLQLISGSSSRRHENRVAEISEISRQLKEMAKELDVPIIALSQVSRQVENRQDKRPTLADLRESGAIEQDADLVAFLYRDEYYNKQSQDTDMAEVILAKHRNGRIGTVKLRFIKKYGGFYNASSESGSRGGRRYDEAGVTAYGTSTVEDAIPMPVKKVENESRENLKLDSIDDIPF